MNNQIEKVGSEKKKRKYPCPSCKGKGRFLEDMVDVWPVYLDCTNCDGQGMIEIGGEIHLRNKAFRLGEKHLEEDKDYDYQEIINIGKKYL